MILSQCHNYWSLMSFTACGVDMTALVISGIHICERHIFPSVKKTRFTMVRKTLNSRLRKVTKEH